jgi:hypothetical protein
MRIRGREKLGRKRGKSTVARWLIFRLLSSSFSVGLE